MKRILSVVMLSVMIGAAGTAAESPKMLSKKELKTLLATASTAEDHNRMAEHYRLKAEKLEANANDPIGMAKVYRARGGAAGTKWPLSTYTTKHCEDLAQHLQKAAKDTRSLSAVHPEMAKE
jgi:hypothetical protein